MRFVTIRISPDFHEVRAVCGRERGKSKLASEAAAACVDVDPWQISHIKESLAEAQSGAPGVLHEDVARWVESWDTEHELPRPKPRKS
jgi:predicted transcriptional regulator